ncbi:DUF4190 domain-containing protein [Leucobacter sp. wl10]|uniref:DUF4190 domain-containing protein n=1 Tax=Leucobacter sp. wl10 TaxID=2304677 RepID=UPI000E5C2FCC|nr:DUF4190 domain-containing protein [Leucobacter sp. wl10]RGE24283.1 DUF4190 domain-containing protein [Leucobacter sp. wl10]
MSTPNSPQQPSSSQGSSQPTTPLPENIAQPGYSPQGGQPAYTPPAAPYQQSAPQGNPQQQSAAQYRTQNHPAPSTATTVGQTNTYALLAIIFAFLSPIAGIVFGHLGLSQVKRTGDAGRGIALTGLIISYAYFLFIALFVILYVGFIVAMIGAFGSMSSMSSNYGPY